MRRSLLLPLLPLLLAAPAAARGQAPLAPPAPRAVVIDAAGVIRWKDDGSEVALFGANYTLPSASDFRAAGYVHADRKRLVDEDMAHFARMGWNGLRLATWGDWESADSLGNLIVNEHQDLLDYVVARARERGIYMLLTPIQTYDAGWPDSLAKSPTYPGFSRKYGRGGLGTDAAAIAAEANHLRQLLEHVNPYTGVAYKDEPSILFVEMINEPWHHPEDSAASVRYIDALVDAVRATGSKQLVFHNVSQDFRIAPAIRGSRVQGVTFGWYPTGLNAGHELRGNYLRTVDAYPAMLAPELRGLPRIVYEFDSPDLRTGYMYPAMVRTFRAVGAQFAAMFAYDMLGTASRNLGWQTHYLNLAYTPRKAMSAVIAAEAMRRLPRMRDYGAYPRNTRFGDFRVSYDENLGELAAADAFLHTGPTATRPPHPERLRRVAGVGSSPVVSYDGLGAWFLDRVEPGVWRLEVYPDAVPVRDPFELPRADKVVTRMIHRAWPMRVRLPDLGAAFSIQPVAGARTTDGARADGGRFTVTPGVYVLSARGPVARERLPRRLGYLRFDELHAPATDSLPLQVVPLVAEEYAAGHPMEVGARVADVTAPDSVTLWVRSLAAGWWRPFPMRPAGAYDYAAALPAGALQEGVYEYAVSVLRGGAATTFPGAVARRPGDWDFSAEGLPRLRVVPARAPLRLFSPAEDVTRLAFTRIGDAVRQGIFRLATSAATGAPTFHLELPVVNGSSPEDYTVSLFVGDRIASRPGAGTDSARLALRVRGLRAGQRLHVTLVEKDGTSWGAALEVDDRWSDRALPLSSLRPTRGVLLPLGYPGTWNYWVGPAAGRGGSGDRVRLADVERLQLSLRPAGDARAAAGANGVEVESVALRFD